MEKRKHTQIVIIILLILIIILIPKKTKQIPESINLLEETEEFDYNNENIQSVISNFRGNQMERLKTTLEFINSNIKYDSDVSISECYKETASKILKKKTGDCVSMARLAIAMLRAQGIQSTTVGGCIKERYTCTSLMALIEPVYVRPPRIKDVTDTKKRGYLHEWIEVIIDNKVYIADPTSEAIFETNCNDYWYYGYDTNNYERCVIDDGNYVQECYGW